MTPFLIGAVLLPGCGDSAGEEQGEEVADAKVECGPFDDLGASLKLHADWEVGDRFPFVATFKKVDSGEQDENYEATREGSFVVEAARGDGHEVEWQLDDGLSVTFGNAPPDQFRETFGDGPEITDPLEVRFSTSRAGAVKGLLNTDELRQRANRMVDLAIEESGESPDAEAEQQLRELLTSAGLIYGRFAEKPSLMTYGYGYRFDPRAPITRPEKFANILGGGLLPGTETIEVTDAMTDEGCVELRIVTRPEPGALRRAVGAFGAQSGSYDAESSEVRGMDAKNEQTVTYDPSAGLIRRIEHVRTVTTDERDLTLRDTFVIDPSSP